MAIVTIVVDSGGSGCRSYKSMLHQQVDAANCFLVYYENKWLAKCPAQFRPKYYCHCLDGICLMFKKKDHVKKLYERSTNKY